MIDMTGAGNNTLTDVTLANLVKNASDLYIKGNAGDTVDLGVKGKGLTDGKTTWTKSGSEEVDGVKYDVWTADDQTLHIQQNINII